HGGPFQCMLDMSKAIDKSYNTFELCLDIRKREYELVFLDMCAMNYIEVLYEILINKKVQKILTYKGFAKFEGINYYEFIKVLEKCNYDMKKNMIKNFFLPVIYLENNIIGEFEKIKKLKSELVKKCLLYEVPNFELEIAQINKIINNNIFEANIAKEILLKKLNYIKYYLSDDVDRSIYLQYSYTKESLWTKFLLLDKFKDENKKNYKYIDLSEQGLRNIILAHDSCISYEELNLKLIKYYKTKEQEYK
ncbi:MAG: hypothetical protein ACRDCW_02030, partial [Sarcina sp.]